MGEGEPKPTYRSVLSTDAYRIRLEFSRPGWPEYLAATFGAPSGYGVDITAAA